MHALLRKLCHYQVHANLSHSTVYRRKLLADLQLLIPVLAEMY